MNFKQVLTHEDVIINGKEAKNFLTWDLVEAKIVESKKETPIKNESNYSPKYNVLCQNDSLLYDLTEELKDRFELKGLMTNCDLSKLIDIFMKNIRVDELIDDEDDDEFCNEDDEAFF